MPVETIKGWEKVSKGNQQKTHEVMKNVERPKTKADQKNFERRRVELPQTS